MLDKLKNLSKQTLIYGTSTIVGRFLNFLLVPFYTNVFMPSEYGIFTVVFAYIAFLNIFFSLGLESGYFKYASTLEIGDDKENFSIPFITIFLNSFLLSILVLIFSPWLSQFLSASRDYSIIIIYSAFILFFDAIVLIPYANLRLNNKAGHFATVRIINIVVNVVLNLLLILVLRMGIEAIFLSNLMASVITFILLLPIVIRNLKFTLNKKLLQELLNFSLPVIPAGLAMIMVQVVSRPIMLYLTDEATVGIFQANFKLGIFMMLLVSMFEYAWKPFFLNQAKEPEAKKIFSKILTLFIGGTSLVLILLTFFIDDLIRIPIPPRGHLIGSKYWSGVVIVPLILFSYQMYGIYINMMSGIYIEKKTKYLPYITGLAAMVNILGNFALIPVWGIIGAAIATFVSYLSMAIFLFYISNKYYPVNYEWNKVIPMMLLNLFVMVLYYVFLYLDIEVHIIAEILLVIVFISITVYLSGFHKATSLIKRLKLKQ